MEKEKREFFAYCDPANQVLLEQWVNQLPTIRKNIEEVYGLVATSSAIDSLVEKEYQKRRTAREDFLNGLLFKRNPINYKSYELCVKPHLPWNKIYESLKIIPKKDEIEKIIFELKPYPIEKIIDQKIRKENIFEKDIKQQIQQIARLQGILKHLPKDPFLRDSDHIEKFRNSELLNMAYFREMGKLMRRIEKENLNRLGIDRNLNKSPQKHPYWNKIVSNAIRSLKPYYRTQKATLQKIAELLKLLYPTIWKEGIGTIANRIKLKNYRVKKSSQKPLSFKNTS